MSTKKKPAAKTPAPLLKVTFAKFPDKPVPVFFDSATRMMTATFGFAEYSAASVSGLEAKINAAIKAGATPTVEWIPVIIITDEGGTYDPLSGDRLDSQLAFQAERKYVALGKHGAIEVDWKVPENLRAARGQDCYELGVGGKRAVALPKLPHASTWGLVLPYSPELWEKVRGVFARVADITASFRQAMKKRDLSSLFAPESAVSSPAAPSDRGKQAERGTASRAPAASKRFPNSAMQAAAVEKKPRTAKPSTDPAKEARAKYHREILDGPLGPKLIAHLGYPDGTTIFVSGNNVDIKPPKHVAMLYSRKWLADRLARADAGEDFSAPPPLFNGAAPAAEAEP
jgi:hypothetical protein